jgi:hypothetical protein
VSLSNYGNILFPPQLGRLVLLQQNDPEGSKAADALDRAIDKQQQRGVTVALAPPPAGFKDLNDILRGAEPQAEAA